MEYNTFPPQNNLSALIKCYWTLESPREENAGKQRVVPDGCMEMIFNYGAVYKQYISNKNYITQPVSFVFGQITSPLDIQPTGITGIFAVRFHPEGFTPFATIPIKQMENRAVPLSELFGDAGINVESEILAATTTAERINIIDSFLISRLLKRESIDHIVKATVEMMITINGSISIVELSQQMQINRRQLERKFSSVIGLSPKQLSKIIRLQATLKTLMSDKFTNLTDLAYEAEYFDQAHFIKDFKEFTGSTPKNFYSDNFKLSILFSGMK